MSSKSIQEILKKVEQPSRYIGTEINSINKSGNTTDLNMVLAFPDLYDIGTSHFGIQILYNILNENENISAERVFAPAIDMEKELRENNIPIFSLESQTELNKFDIIGFSLLYELNYSNILTILDLAKIPFLSKDRDESFPFIIAGGPGTFNPEPVAEIFDAIVIGDGEKVIIEISEKYIKWKNNNKNRNKNDFLKILSEIEGVYIPSFFEVEYEKIGDYSFQVLKPVYDNYTKIKKAIVSDLEKVAFPESPIIPFGKPIHDRLRLEISRGCSRGCRFCQAGMIYRPVRERKVDSLIDITNKAVCNTGYEDVSLLSLSTADYENLNMLMRQLMEVDTNNTDKKLSFSLPSVRAGKLTPELMETIKKVKKTGFTIAPEAGSQRLRDVINKGITEEEIITTVENAFTLGWKNIKLYFMIGLPTETIEDLEGIIDIVRKLKKIKPAKGKKPNITVSVSTFIPKPHTPFQWEKQISEEESWEKIIWLRENLKINGVTFKWGKTDISYLEGIISRGDRRITPLIINAYNKGCRFDGWNEHFKIDLWKKAIEEENIDVFYYTQRIRDINEPLAWDIVDTGISKQFFIDELDKGIKELLTKDCRYGECTGCGICDFDKIKPIIEDKQEYVIEETTKEKRNEIEYKKIKVKYSKTGKAKYFGHLELINIFTSSIIRAEVPVKYSSGFNPMVKIVFNNPLPLGYESYDEFFIIQTYDSYPIENIKEIINPKLPEGLDIKECKTIHNKFEGREKDNNKFIIKIDNYSFEENELEHFNNTESVLIEKTNKKGKIRELELKEFVKIIKINNSTELEIDIIKIDGITVRPEIVVKKVFSLSDELIKTMDIIKLKNY